MGFVIGFLAMGMFNTSKVWDDLWCWNFEGQVVGVWRVICEVLGEGVVLEMGLMMGGGYYWVISCV